MFGLQLLVGMWDPIGPPPGVNSMFQVWFGASTFVAHMGALQNFRERGQMRRWWRRLFIYLIPLYPFAFLSVWAVVRRIY